MNFDQILIILLLLLLLLFNGLLKNYSNRRQRQNYRNSNNIKSTMYKNKNKICILDLVTNNWSATFTNLVYKCVCVCLGIQTGDL